jgi:hypothetical protein
VGKVSVLRHSERVRVNASCLVELFASLGEARAESAVCRAVDELAACISDLRRHAAAGADPQVVRSARRISTIAVQIGMSTLCRVARDVMVATSAGDRVAQAATIARLTRISDQSLVAIWDLRGVSV